jgi:hypothetical protein
MNKVVKPQILSGCNWLYCICGVTPWDVLGLTA